MSTASRQLERRTIGLISRRQLRFALTSLVLLILLAAAVNGPVAVLLTPARRTPTPNVLRLSGAEAAARRWPAPTPHALPWPEPTEWTVESAWPGHRRIRVWGNPTHQMQVDEIGWPWPALREVQMWWPWDEPQWRSEAPPDPGLHVAWAGLVLNSLVLGTGLWAVVVAVPMAVIALRRARRARRGLCRDCGYPVGTSPVCTECGRAAPGKSAERSPAPTAVGGAGLGRDGTRIIRRGELHTVLGVLVMLVLATAAVNVPLGVMLSVARNTPVSSGPTLHGPHIAGHGWPVSSPHDRPWPAPTQRWSNSAWTGHRRVQAQASTEQETTHSMYVDESGLPLPVLREVRFRWPESDPAWATTSPSDPGLSLAWKGVLMNPLQVGTGVWLLLAAWPMGAVMLDRAIDRIARARAAHQGDEGGGGSGRSDRLQDHP